MKIKYLLITIGFIIIYLVFKNFDDINDIDYYKRKLLVLQGKLKMD